MDVIINDPCHAVNVQMHKFFNISNVQLEFTLVIIFLVIVKIQVHLSRHGIHFQVLHHQWIWKERLAFIVLLFQQRLFCLGKFFQEMFQRVHSKRNMFRCRMFFRHMSMPRTNSSVHI